MNKELRWNMKLYYQVVDGSIVSKSILNVYVQINPYSEIYIFLPCIWHIFIYDFVCLYFEVVSQYTLYHLKDKQKNVVNFVN